MYFLRPFDSLKVVFTIKFFYQNRGSLQILEGINKKLYQYVRGFMLKSRVHKSLFPLMLSVNLVSGYFQVILRFYLGIEKKSSVG